MSTEDLSIYLYCFQFLSSMFYKCSAYTSFISLVQFIAGYFILFDATVNGAVVLISLFLAYRNATDFCVLIFVACNFTKCFDQFWVQSLGFSCCHLQIVTFLLLPFQTGCLLFLFLAYLLWQELPNTMLNVESCVFLIQLETPLTSFHFTISLFWPEGMMPFFFSPYSFLFKA